MCSQILHFVKLGLSGRVTKAAAEEESTRDVQIWVAVLGSIEGAGCLVRFRRAPILGETW